MNKIISNLNIFIILSTPHPPPWVLDFPLIPTISSSSFHFKLWPLQGECLLQHAHFFQDQIFFPVYYFWMWPLLQLPVLNILACELLAHIFSVEFSRPGFLFRLRHLLTCGEDSFLFPLASFEQNLPFGVVVRIEIENQCQWSVSCLSYAGVMQSKPHLHPRIRETWEGLPTYFQWKFIFTEQWKYWSNEINHFKFISSHLAIGPHLLTSLFLKWLVSVLQKNLNWLSAVFVQFELQWMLIHCDPLRPSRETCHELPPRITVSPLDHWQRPLPPSWLLSILPPTLFLKRSELCCTDQISIKEAQVPPKTWKVRFRPPHTRTPLRVSVLPLVAYSLPNIFPRTLLVCSAVGCGALVT